MNSVVEEVKSRLNIVDIVGEYVKLDKAGANWKALCPFHHEKGPSFMVQEEKQIYHCFGCGKGGDIISFIMEIESVDFKEALKILAERAGVQLAQYNPQAGKDKNIALEILELATKFYETQLWKGMGADKALPYLKERGLSEDSIRNFRLGYAPDGWRNILNFLIERGYKVEDIAKTGLLVEKNNDSVKAVSSKLEANYYDRFRDRIMFPICDAMGKVVGYSARVAPGGDESQAKYINTPESSVYHKSKALYGIHKAKNGMKEKSFALLVEGNMDVIAAHQAGFSNTVAVSGTALTGDQLDIIKRYTENIKMMFDMDSAGQQAAERSADLCFQKGLNVHVVALSEGKDAADVVQKNPQQLVDAVTQSVPAMEYFLKRITGQYDLAKPEDKKMIANRVVERLKHVSNQIEQSFWVKKLAQQLDVEEKVIQGVLQAVSGSQRPQFSDEQLVIDGSSFKKRSDILRDKIAGLLMSDPVVWEKFTKEHGNDSILRNEGLLRYIFDKGPQVAYSFEALLLGALNDAQRKRLQQVYFDARYHFDAKGNAAEYSREEVEKIAAQFILEYKKELQKQRLTAIIKEIKLAEQSGDKEKLNILMREFTELSQELK